MKNYYEVLEISENASQEVIERVYKLFAKKYHPDVNPTNPKEAEEKFKEVTEAYETLSDESKRKAYDDKLKYEKQKQTASSQTYQNDNYNSNKHNTTNSNKTSYENYSSPNYKNVSNYDTQSYAKEKAEADRIFDEMAYENLQQLQAEREYQIKKAYNDAYIEALKSMGIRVVYKKTFKEKVRAFFNVLIFVLILTVIAFVLWQIPSIRAQVQEALYFIPFVK